MYSEPVGVQTKQDQSGIPAKSFISCSSALVIIKSSVLPSRCLGSFSKDKNDFTVES